MWWTSERGLVLEYRSRLYVKATYSVSPSDEDVQDFVCDQLGICALLVRHGPGTERHTIPFETSNS